MKPILVHCHIYYTEMWPELKACLQNITTEYDLFVTMVEDNKELQNDILSFKPEAHVKIVPNKGFDIASFINVLNKVDLNDYDYIIKLHTKRDMPMGTLVNGWNLSGCKWRDYLLKFLKDQKTFQCYLTAFEKDNKLGMVSDFRAICKKDKSNEEAVKLALEKLYEMKLKPIESTYVMGTMFMAKANLFELVRNLNLDFDNFTDSVRKQDNFPYALERLFGYLINEQGHEIRDPIHNKYYQFATKICAVIRNFIYRKKLCSDGKIIVKICKVPLITKINKDNQIKISLFGILPLYTIIPTIKSESN